MWLPCLLGALLSGCITVRPVVVDRKTALENQILGSFQRLESELILASSVRGAGSPGAKLSPLQREALEALLRREFNRDDIELLKDQQVVGEGNDGLLKLLTAAGRQGAGGVADPGEGASAATSAPVAATSAPVAATSAPVAATGVHRVRLLVEQENHDRTVIVRRVIQLDPQLGDGDLAQVQRVLARLMAQTARPGHQVQLPDGRWHTISGQQPAEQPAAAATGNVEP